MQRLAPDWLVFGEVFRRDDSAFRLDELCQFLGDAAVVEILRWFVTEFFDRGGEILVEDEIAWLGHTPVGLEEHAGHGGIELELVLQRRDFMREMRIQRESILRQP